MHEFDEQLVALERAQHGLVALRQVSDTWKPGLIRRRLRERRERVGPGTFVNPSVRSSFEQRVMAAVLSAGADAFASHETAVQLSRLPLPRPAALELTTSDRRRPLVSGARMHRATFIDARDVIVARGTPTMAPPLAIYSVSSRFSITQLGLMADEAVRLEIMRLDELVEVVERVRPANGRSRKKMRMMLARRLD